jgi:hypothetical protein
VWSRSCSSLFIVACESRSMPYVEAIFFIELQNCKTAKYNTKGVSVQSHNLCKTRHNHKMSHIQDNMNVPYTSATYAKRAQLNLSHARIYSRMETNSNINQGHNTNWPSKVLRVNQRQFLQRSNHVASTKPVFWQLLHSPQKGRDHKMAAFWVS